MWYQAATTFPALPEPKGGREELLWGNAAGEAVNHQLLGSTAALLHTGCD